MSTTIDQQTIRRGDVIRAEITKVTTHPATMLMLTVAFAANVLLAAIDASGVTFYTGGPGGSSSLSSFGIVMLAPIYAFLVIPVYAAATEYQGGQLRMSLIATPKRSTFVIAKVIAMLSTVLLGAIVAVVPARLIMSIASGSSIGEILADSGLWVAAYVFMSIVAFGLAGVLRGAIAPLGIMIALPMVLATGVLQWPAGLRFLPDQAALSLVGTPQFDVHELPAGVATVTLVIWSIVAVVVYTLAIRRRDA